MRSPDLPDTPVVESHPEGGFAEAARDSDVDAVAELDTAQASNSAGGYAGAFEAYFEAGWTGVLPLRRGTKWPPPSGYTGREGGYPTRECAERWAATPAYRGGGLCLRLHDGVIGIDVDAYGTKRGAATLVEAEKRWGPLPPTVCSTSRTDGVSGIKLFRVPWETELVGVVKFPELGLADVDIIQPGHRYVVCFPSVHPEGRPYRWFCEVTGREMSEPPSPGELAELPHTWLDGLRADAASTRSAGSPREAGLRRSPGTTAGYNVWAAMTDGRPSLKVAARLAAAISDLDQGVSRHDTMLGHVMALLRLGERGESGVGLSLETLCLTFVAAVGSDRPGGDREAEAEFIRMVTNAERLLADPDALPNKQTDEAARAEAVFWAQRPILTHIQRFAAYRRANPYATLGAVLRRAITHIPPSVQLPPIVGDAASVNLFTASVGRSGQGKDIANGVGAQAVRFVLADGTALEDPDSPGIGSGEGLARIFKGHGNGDELAQVAANVEINEVSSLAALADRKGSTVVGELLKAFTGQAIGFTNAQRATTTFISRHSYRLCLGVSAQPENADFFLNREKDGLPQRFLWLPIVNPFARPPGDDAPAEVVPAEVVIRTFPTIVSERPYMIGVPESVRSAIQQFRYLVEIGSDQVDPLDGHLMLVRLKVAFGLAVLDERRDITDDDWRIAGQLIEVSNRVRTEMRTTVKVRRSRENAARAHAAAERQTIIDDHLSQAHEDRVSRAIKNKLKREGTATRRQLRKACTLAIRGDFDPVFDKLLAAGEIVICDGGARYELPGEES